jgi:predicted metal-dependent phosphoesterase TrpH
MKADLHVHSTHSGDGRQTVEEIIARCRELGVGAVAISDHNTFKAHQGEVRSIPGLIIIPAVEVTSLGGHINALGVSELIPRDRGVGETIERIHAAGGIAVAVHPYRKWSGLGEKNVIEHRFDAVEVANGRSKRSGNLAAGRLARRLGSAEVGGSDAHESPSIGRAYTEVPEDCRNQEDVIRAIIEGRCKAHGTGQPWYLSFVSAVRNVARWLRRGLKRM